MIQSKRFLGMPPLLAVTALIFLAASLPATMFGYSFEPAPLAAAKIATEEEPLSNFRIVGVTEEGSFICHRQDCYAGCCYVI
jgi:hypothetical protein